MKIRPHLPISDHCPLHVPCVSQLDSWNISPMRRFSVLTCQAPPTQKYKPFRCDRGQPAKTEASVEDPPSCPHPIPLPYAFPTPTLHRHTRPTQKTTHRTPAVVCGHQPALMDTPRATLCGGCMGWDEHVLGRCHQTTAVLCVLLQPQQAQVQVQASVCSRWIACYALCGDGGERDGITLSYSTGTLQCRRLELISMNPHYFADSCQYFGKGDGQLEIKTGCHIGPCRQL